MAPNSFLVVENEAGDELSRRAVEIAAVVEPQESTGVPPLPSALDWYRDAARWWTTAAAALLVFGIGYLPGADQGGLRVSFVVAGVLLMTAVGFGIYYHVCVLELGKSWENLNALEGAKDKGDNQEKREKEQTHFDKTSSRLGWLHYPLFAAFAVGFAILAISIATGLWNEDPSSTQFLVHSDLSNRHILVDSHSGEIWQLATDEAGNHHWVPLAEGISDKPP